MSQHDPEVLVIFQIDPLHEVFEVVGVFSQRADAEAVLANLPAECCPHLFETTMSCALGQIRADAHNERYQALEKRLDGLAERVGQLTAVLTAQRAAA